MIVHFAAAGHRESYEKAIKKVIAQLINSNLNSNLLVSVANFTMVETVPQPEIVRFSLVTAHYEHLQEGELVTESLIQVLKGLSDLARSGYSIVWAERGTPLRPSSNKVLKVDSW